MYKTDSISWYNINKQADNVIHVNLLYKEIIIMKKKAQITVAVLFLLSFIKSFFYSSNAYDIVFILSCLGIYLSYEYIQDRMITQKIEELKKETEEKFKVIEKEQKDTKQYVSSVSAGIGFKR